MSTVLLGNTIIELTNGAVLSRKPMKLEQLVKAELENIHATYDRWEAEDRAREHVRGAVLGGDK